MEDDEVDTMMYSMMITLTQPHSWWWVWIWSQAWMKLSLHMQVKTKEWTWQCIKNLMLRWMPNTGHTHEKVYSHIVNAMITDTFSSQLVTCSPLLLRKTHPWTLVHILPHPNVNALAEDSSCLWPMGLWQWRQKCNNCMTERWCNPTNQRRWQQSRNEKHRSISCSSNANNVEDQGSWMHKWLQLMSMNFLWRCNIAHSSHSIHHVDGSDWCTGRAWSGHDWCARSIHASWHGWVSSCKVY